MTNSTNDFNEAIFKEGDLRPSWHGIMSEIFERNDLDLVQEYSKDKFLSKFDFNDFDFIPYIITNNDYKKIIKGICQQARFANALLNDIYGEQKLIKKNILPIKSVYGNPLFKYEFHNKIKENRFVNFFSCDLIKINETKFLIKSIDINDLTSFSRLILSRNISSQNFKASFLENNVLRLNKSLANFKKAIINGTNYDSPTIIVLGKSKEAMFFANEMGFIHAKNSYIKVKGNQAFLKNVKYDKEINLIINFDNDINEIKGFENIIHLFYNFPFKSLASSFVYRSYEDNILKELLDEDKILYHVQTYYAGIEKERKILLSKLDKIDVFDGFENKQINNKDKKEILLNSYKYVGIENADPSLAPWYENKEIVYKPTTLKIFAFLNQDGEYEIFNSMMGYCEDKIKDVWITSNEPEIIEFNEQAYTPSYISGQNIDFNSETVKDFYDLGKKFSYLWDLTKNLKIALIENNKNPEKMDERSLSFVLSNIANSFDLIEKDLDFTCISTIDKIFKAYPYFFSKIDETIKEIKTLTSKLWIYFPKDVLKSISDISNYDVSKPYLENLDMIFYKISSIIGVLNETMVKDNGIKFFDLGFRINNAYLILELIKTFKNNEITGMPVCLKTILKLCFSYKDYQKRYFMPLENAKVFDMIILKHDNPSSLYSQIVKIREYLEDFYKEGEIIPLVLKKIMSIKSKIEGMDIIYEYINDEDPDQKVWDFMNNIKQEITNLEEIISKTYFKSDIYYEVKI
ncbi:MAG: hypothetical protein BWY78_00470 [Alphaproteobacteria bacterium ADurb.Bin438]|nr:MAG: hypothetical protein BWY78_00470 [Alphaproteobacteria bacterium ADurb.Bin438]